VAVKRLALKRLALLAMCALLLLPAAPAQAAGSFTNPLNGSADPTLTYFNGSYYLATTLGDRIGYLFLLGAAIRCRLSLRQPGQRQ
jgi:hypothetical protein